MKAGFVLYASDDSEEAIAEAREYIRSRGLTRDDVRLIKRMHGDMKMVMVEVKRPCKLKVG